MYQLFLDKAELFECSVSVKNASLKDSFARLILESDSGINYVFNGTIENETCTVPIKRMKGLLEENSRGNIFLEFVVEDMFFRPWKDTYEVAQHTSVKVKVDENKTNHKQSTKPILEVKVPNFKSSTPSKTQTDFPIKDEYVVPVYELYQLCNKFNISRHTIKSKHPILRQLLTEYFNYNKEYKNDKSIILKNLKYFI